jgi:uncharacterized protein YciI
MPLFVIIGRDGADGAARRDQHRAAHVAHIEALDRAGRILLAGTPRNETNDASVGVVIVFEACDLDEAREIANRDPFVTGGVFESLTVAPFKRVYPKQP